MRLDLNVTVNIRFAAPLQVEVKDSAAEAEAAAKLAAGREQLSASVAANALPSEKTPATAGE